MSEKHQGENMNSQTAGPVDPGLIVGAVLVVLAASWMGEVFATAHTVSMLRYVLFPVF
jgi:hypothetical protein